MAEAGGPSGGEAAGWLFLGVLNEALLGLLHHADLGSFWRETCVRARWVVPCRRMAVVLAEEGGGAAVVERSERGTCLGGLPAGGAVMDPWLRGALEAARAAWLLPPWEEARRVDALRGWLLEGDPAAVLHAPLRSQRGTFGALLFAAAPASEADRSALVAAAMTYALYVGAAFTGLGSRAALEAASAALAAQNEELARKNDALEQAQAELSRQLAVVGAQHEQLLALSAPLVEAGEGVLALPVVGAVDEARAARLTEVALEAVARRGARLLVLDLTSARVGDSAAAPRLARIARAVGLLGAECAISGVSPEMARELLAVGEDHEQLPVHRSLRQALATAGSARRTRAR